MTLPNTHALGRNRKFFVKEEATTGTFAKPAATDAAKVLKFEIDYKQARKDRMDSRSSRSVLERITGRKSIAFSGEAYVIPSGSAGTAPDLGPIFEAAFGTETVNASTSVVYSLSSSQAMPTVMQCHHYNDSVMEAVWGCVIDSLSIKGSGGDDPKVSWEGQAMGYRMTGNTTLSGAMSSSDQMSLTDATAAGINSVVKIGSDDNSGAGYAVTAGTGNPYTIASSISASNGATVTPFVPSETVAGTPIGGISGSITLASMTGLVVTSYEVTLKNVYKAIDDEAFQSAPTDFIPGTREVTGSLTVRARKDFIIELTKRHSFGARDLALVLGTSAGKILTLDLNYIEFEFSKLEMPETDEGSFQLPFKALGSSGEDELTATFT